MIEAGFFRLWRRLPLTHRIIEAPLLKFKMPSLGGYDGNSDSDYHLQHFMMTIRLNNAIKPLICMAFPTTLQKSARDWFNNLAPRSIYSFKELSNAFCNHFAISKKRGKNLAQLLSISHDIKEKPRDYIHSFNLERLEMEDWNDETFTND